MRNRLLAALWAVPLLSAVSLGAGRDDLRLMEAVRNGDRAAVRALLKEPVEVNATEADGATALHWAAHRDDLELAGLLIRSGADANAANDHGVTPLTLASANGSAAMVERLLAAGGNPNAATAVGEPVLMTAARAGSVRAVRALIARGANVNAKEPTRGQTALMWAVALRHPEVARALIELGADVHVRSVVTRVLINRGDPFANVGSCCPAVDETEEGGSTALLFAARHGDLDSAHHLLTGGANINDSAADGSSVLVVATHSGHRAFAEWLLTRGADPNAGGVGYTALHAAVLRGDVEMVRALLAHGASPNIPLTKGTPVTRYAQDLILPQPLVGATPFLLAAKFLEVDIMRALLAGGADPALPKNDGTTSVMAALGMAQINPGADRRERLARGRVRPHETLILEAVRLGVEAGADVNARNQAGDTALHGAAAGRFDAVIEFLAKHGADMNVPNEQGLTPLEIAAGRQPLSDDVADAGTVVRPRGTADLLRQLGAKQ